MDSKPKELMIRSIDDADCLGKHVLLRVDINSPVDSVSDDNQKLWVVNALEQNIYNDMSGYARVIPFKKLSNENRKCKNRDLDCILNIYKKNYWS